MPKKVLLSPFQREKLEYYFNFFDPNEDGCLDEHSVDRLMKRVLEFTGWDPLMMKAKECEEIHRAFFEILFERQKPKDGSSKRVTLEQWMNMWASILPGCMGIQNFPVWLRLLPKTLFFMIDRNNDRVVGPAELVAFYKDMVRIPEEIAESRAMYAYDQMTDGGRWPLHLDSYEMIFSNFLIGRTPFGPGRHIFGCFEHKVTSFQLIERPHDDDDDDDKGDGGEKSDSAEKRKLVPRSSSKPFRQDSKTKLF